MDDRSPDAPPALEEVLKEADDKNIKNHKNRAKQHDPYAALRSRQYRLFSIGWMAAVVGQMMTSTAIAWEVYERTKDNNAYGYTGYLAGKPELALGFLAGIQVIPLVLLALPGGILADRFDRRKILILACIGAAFCSTLLFTISTYHAPLILIYLTLLASSSCLTLGRPSRSSILPNLVKPEDFPNAITWNASFFQLSAMAGPALGGLLLAWSVRPVYLIDAGCSIFYALLVLQLPPIRALREPGHVPEPTLHMLKEGLRFVFSTKLILATLTLDLFAVLLGGVVYLLPVFTREILHVSAMGFGWLRAAESAGALAMALVIAHLPPMRNAGRSLLMAVAGFGVCTIIFGLSRNFWLSFAMLFMIGALDNISVVVRHTLVQVLTPDRMRGRVSAVNNIFIGASNELGGLESGVTAHWLTPMGSAIFGGVGTILTVFLVAGVWPQIRKIGSLTEQKAEG